jgi:cytochrome c5
MIRRAVLLNLTIGALLVDVSLVFGQSSRQTGQGTRIVDEIARLGSPSKPECAAAVKALVTIGKPAAPALVAALSDPRNDVRAFSAEALRLIIAADPANAPNYHDEAYWTQRVARLEAGMMLDHALELLLPELTPAERQKRGEGGAWSGGSGTSTYRLDDYWAVHLYLMDFGKEKLHEHVPDLFRSVRRVWVAPPDGYTGKWVTWHVNGQKANDIQYRNGQYDGKFTAFYDNGSKCFQQHYTQHVCHGTDTGWHRDGKRAYEGRYEHGKQVGTWRWWNENGQIESVKEYEQ